MDVQFVNSRLYLNIAMCSGFIPTSQSKGRESPGKDGNQSHILCFQYDYYKKKKIDPHIKMSTSKNHFDISY